MTHEVTNTQRYFLWIGEENRRRNNWVVWYTICKPKYEGGLGVMEVESFNRPPLSRWDWRILLEENSYWRSLIIFKYKDPKRLILDSSWKVNDSKLWWRDLEPTFGSCGDDNNWFRNSIACKLGDGSFVDFLQHKWLGPTPLHMQFPILFGCV